MSSRGSPSGDAADRSIEDARWNNDGLGWYDLFAPYPAWPGQLVFDADAECRSPPVPVGGKTWGGVKQLYDE